MGNNEENKKNLSAIFAVISLYGPSINYCLSMKWGYSYTEVITGGIMFAFSIISLAFGFLRYAQINCLKYEQLFIFTILIGISLFWFVNYYIEYNFEGGFTGYDKKRPIFYIYGVLIFGAVGVLASVDSYNFLRDFFKTSVIATVVLCIMYLMLYDSNEETARIGGDAGLIIGILIGQGGASLFAGYKMDLYKTRIVFIMIPLLLLSIIMSGTRSALIAFVLVTIILFFNDLKKMGINKIGVKVLLYTSSALLFLFIINKVPEQFAARIMNFNLEGSEDRGMLLKIGINILQDNLMGKVTGLYEYFPAEIEYSHNTTLQIIIEIGVVSLILYEILIAGVLMYIYNHKIFERKISSGIFYYGLSILLVSFSAGSAYDAQYWMLLTLLSTLGFRSLAYKHHENKRK